MLHVAVQCEPNTTAISIPPCPATINAIADLLVPPPHGCRCPPHMWILVGVVTASPAYTCTTTPRLWLICTPSSWRLTESIVLDIRIRLMLMLGPRHWLLLLLLLLLRVHGPRRPILVPPHPNSTANVGKPCCSPPPAPPPTSESGYAA